MKTFVIMHDPFELFNGRQVYKYTGINAGSCLQAVVFFRHVNNRANIDADVRAVKPAGAMKWRRDKSLTDRNQVIRAGIALGWLETKEDNGEQQVKTIA